MEFIFNFTILNVTNLINTKNMSGKAIMGLTKWPMPIISMPLAMFNDVYHLQKGLKVPLKSKMYMKFFLQFFISFVHSVGCSYRWYYIACEQGI